MCKYNKAKAVYNFKRLKKDWTKGSFWCIIIGGANIVKSQNRENL